jgi:hypothetical protein
LTRTGRAAAREQARQLADLVQAAEAKGLVNLNPRLAKGET